MIIIIEIQCTGQSTVAAEVGGRAGQLGEATAGTTSRVVGWWLAGCAGTPPSPLPYSDPP